MVPEQECKVTSLKNGVVTRFIQYLGSKKRMKKNKGRTHYFKDRYNTLQKKTNGYKWRKLDDYLEATGAAVSF